MSAGNFRGSNRFAALNADGDDDRRGHPLKDVTNLNFERDRKGSRFDNSEGRIFGGSARSVGKGGKG